MTTSNQLRKYAMSIAATIAIVAIIPQTASADCNFSGGKIFSLTAKADKEMTVLATFTGSGKWWMFTTKDLTFKTMLTSAFFNEKRIYITGENETCEIQRYTTLGSAAPRMGGNIKQLFAL